jgi:hypothetical protein
VDDEPLCSDSDLLWPDIDDRTDAYEDRSNPRHMVDAVGNGTEHRLDAPAEIL